jgi:hypothetical protein
MKRRERVEKVILDVDAADGKVPMQLLNPVTSRKVIKKDHRKRRNSQEVQQIGGGDSAQ